MPQLRSFSAFAPAPQLAQSYTSGVGLAQQDEALAAKVATDRAQMATQYAIAEMETATRRQALMQEALTKNQAIEAEKQMLDMRLAAQREQLKQESMLKDQELEIEKYYKTGMLGLNERQTVTEEKKVAFTAAQAHQEQVAREKISSRIAELTSMGKVDQQTAMRQAVSENIAYLPSGVQAQLLQEQNSRFGPAPAPPKAVEIEGLKGKKAVWTGQSWQLADEKTPEDLTANPVPGAPDLIKIGKSIRTSAEWKEATKAEAEADKREEQLLNGDDWQDARKLKGMPFEEMTDSNKQRLVNYENMIIKVRRQRVDAQKKKADLTSRAMGKTQSGGSKTNATSKYTVVEE